MTVTYTWTNFRKRVAPSLDNLPDVVLSVLWQRDAVDDTDPENPETVFTTGETPLPPPNPGDFMPNDEVTAAVLQGWLEAALGEEGIAAIDAGLVVALEASGPDAPFVEVAPETA